MPAEGLAEQVGGYLPLIEGANGKVPQGIFAAAGLVDAVIEGLAVEGEGDEEGVVGASQDLVAPVRRGSKEVVADVGVAGGVDARVNGVIGPLVLRDHATGAFRRR